jgi:hypothetical protein
MAKQKRDLQPIKEADIKAYLDQSDDFKFEIDVLRMCHGGGLVTSHGGSYEDPITKKNRQFDIRTQITKGLCTLKLAIECKNLRESFPLLVSRMPRREDESYHEVLLSSAARHRDFLIDNNRAGADRREVKNLFQYKALVGKDTVQVGRTQTGEFVGNDAEVFEKWSQAIGSAYDLIGASSTDHQRLGSACAATVIFPILVVTDGTLWAVDYSAEGGVLGDPHLVNECSIYLGKTISTARGIDYKLSHLQIFTKTAFDGYLNRIAVNDKYWDLIFPSAPLNNWLLQLEVEAK